MFDPSKYIAFDIETTSAEDTRFALQPWRAAQGRARLSSFATAWHDGTRIQSRAEADPTVGQLADMLKDAIDNDQTIVGWNTVFDASWLCALGLSDLVLQAKWLDGMLLWQHLVRRPDEEGRQRQSFGLKKAVAEFLPKFAGYDEGVDFHDMSREATVKRLKYNRLDAALTFKLTQKFYDQLAAEGAQRIRNARIEAAAIGPFANAIAQGLHVNVGHAQELSRKLLATKAKLGEALAEHGLDDALLSSPVRLRKLLYEVWELPVTVTTPKGDPSTDKAALFELSKVDPRAAQIRDYREAGNLKTKFVDKVLESVEYNGGTTHPAPRIAGTYSGRVTFSSSQGTGKQMVQTGFAIHQMKRSGEYRKIIKAPPGFVLCEWDAAGQEYRWMAIESGDEVMQDLCRGGNDPHAYMGAQFSGLAYDDLRRLVKEGDKNAKLYRQIGKLGNLSCQYRIGLSKLTMTATNPPYELPLTEQQVNMLIGTYHRTYQQVRVYWDKKIGLAMNRGYAETLAGRRVQLAQEGWSDSRRRWSHESTAINFPIQGIGADQKYLAIKVVQPILTKFGGRVYFELHDGIYAILPEKVADKAARMVRHALNNMPYQKAWGFTPPIPLPWDLKMGPSWGEMKEID